MSVSQGDDALGTEQQVITPNRGHNGRCKYDSTAKSKAQNTTNHFSLIYTLQALVFTYPDDIYDLFASILLRNGQWARPSLNFSLLRIFYILDINIHFSIVCFTSFAKWARRGRTRQTHRLHSKDCLAWDF